MKRIEVKKLIPYVSIMLMCMSVTACGHQSSTNTSAAEDTTISSEEQLKGDDTELPDGEAPKGDAPEKPDGEAPGEPPSGDKPDGVPGEGPGGGFGGGGMSSADIDYTGAVEITASDSQDDQAYKSTTADESALLITTSEL